MHKKQRMMKLRKMDALKDQPLEEEPKNESGIVCWIQGATIEVLFPDYKPNQAGTDRHGSRIQLKWWQQTNIHLWTQTLCTLLNLNSGLTQLRSSTWCIQAPHYQVGSNISTMGWGGIRYSWIWPALQSKLGRKSWKKSAMDAFQLAFLEYNGDIYFGVILNLIPNPIILMGGKRIDLY